MKRPYDIDDSGIIHGPESNCDYLTNGDSSEKGVIEGLTGHGEGLCPHCIDDEKRIELWRQAAEKVELLG